MKQFIYLVCFVVLLGMVIGLLFWYPNWITKKRLDKVEADWKMLRIAMASQAVDNCGDWLPPDTNEHRITEPSLPLTFELSLSYVSTKQLEEKKQGNYGGWSSWYPLTTPIAYCQSIPKDPFHPRYLYGYTCWQPYIYKEHHKTVAVLYSPGPDKKENLPLIKLRTILDDYFKTYPSNCFTVADFAFLRETITPVLYDPTNGIKSSGDLIWIIDRDSTPYGWRRDIDRKWLYSFSRPAIEPRNQSSSLVKKERTTTMKKGYLAMPKSFYNQMKNISVFSQTRPPVFLNRNLNDIRNKLGKYFDSFYTNPKPLNEQEQKAFEDWKKTSPDWWNAIDQFSPLEPYQDTVDLPTEGIYTIVPLFGKSQLLLAADEWNRNQNEKALRRISDLRVLLEYIGDIDNYERSQRIERELTRLSFALAQQITQQTESAK